MFFCDLVGSTSLAENRDDDEVRELLAGYYEAAKTVVVRYGGIIQKFIGDAVVAVWGAPRALEDDAGRAVRAALELLDAVSAFGQRIGHPSLMARAGVVTGRAAAVLDSDVIVVGDRVNTAARIQSSAQPGEVLVDDVTFEATRSSVGYVDAGTFELKGKSKPEHLWRAERVVAGTAGFDRLDGLEARFMGRESELRLVKELFHTTVDRRSARLVSVAGPAGSGKSRLKSEFYRYVDGLVDTIFWHAGRCPHYGEGVSFWALSEIVRQRFGIAEDDDIDTAISQMSIGLEDLIQDPDDRSFIQPRVAHLLGASGGERSRQDLFSGWRLLFERMAEQHPVILAVEDLQWADTDMLEFLDSILDWSAQYPILLLTLTRPELVEKQPGWGQRRNATIINLEPLGPDAMTDLLTDLVQDLPADLISQIAAQSDGLPLFAVETIQSLIDRDAIRPIEGSYRLVGEVDRLQVPATLTALLSARLDALQADERSLVKAISVLGISFPPESVAGVTDVEADRVEQLIRSLINKGILAVRSDRLSPERGQLQFTQNLLRSVAYDTLTRREKRRRHLDAAAQLRKAFPDDGAEVADLIAWHYQTALDLAPGDQDAATIRENAAVAYRRAGERSADLGAPAAAFSAFQRAALLLKGTGRDLEVIAAAGRMALRAGLWDESKALLGEAANRLDEEGRQDEARGLVADRVLAEQHSGHAEEALRVAREALNRVPPDAVDRGTGSLSYRHAKTLIFEGQIAESARLTERAIGIASSLDDGALLADSLDAESTRLWYAGQLVLARLVGRGAVEASRASGPLDRFVIHLSNLGDQMLGSDLPAVEVLRESVDGARRLGDPGALAMSIGNLVNALIYEGEWDEALALANRTVEEETAYRGAGSMIPHDRLVLIHSLRGDIAAAHTSFDRASDLLIPSDVQDVLTHAAARSTMMLAEGDNAGVLTTMGQITEQLAVFGMASEMIRQLWPDAAEAALRSGDWSSAERLIAMLEQARPGRVPPYLRAQLERTRARLTAASGSDEHVKERLRLTIERFGAIGYPYWEAMARLDLAGWLIDEGRNAESAPLLQAASQTFEGLGARPDLARARRLGAADRVHHVVEP